MGYGDSYQGGVYGGGDDEATGIRRSAGGSIMSGGNGSSLSWQINPNGEGLIGTPSSYGGGGRGGGGGGSGNRTVTSRTVYSGKAPTMGDLPTLVMPKVDKRRIRALQQQSAAPMVRKLREGLSGAMNISTDNPNVRRMTLREALQGYGTGLESAMSGAGREARAEHQQELNLLSAEAQANWQSQVQKINAEYQNAYNAWINSATKVTETTEGAGDGSGVWYRTPFGSLRRTGPGGSRDSGSY